MSQLMQNKHQLEWAREVITAYNNNVPYSHDLREFPWFVIKQAQAIIADAEAIPPVVAGQTIEAEYSLKYWRYVDDGKTIKIFFKGAE